MILKKYSDKYCFNFYLILFFSIGVLLRLYNVLEQSYWLDEIIAANISNPKNKLSFVVFETLKGAPPLYQIILWICYNFFGFNELTGRLFSVFCGCFALLFIYFLGKELFNKYVGLYTVLIASLNQFLIYYSQETRAYSLLFLLSIVSTYFFVKFFYGEKKRFLILYIISIIFNFYTHYFGFLVLGFHGVFVLLNVNSINKLKLKYVFIAFFVIILSIIPLLQSVLELEKIKDFWISKPSFFFWINYFHSYFKSIYLDIIYVFLILFSLRYCVKNFRIEKNKYVFLMIWMLFSYTLPYLRSVFFTPLLTERNTIIVLPAIILLIASGIFLINKIYVRVAVIIAVVCFSFMQLYSSNYYFKPKKQQWRTVIETVKKNNTKNFLIYDVVYSGNLYSTYIDMLKLNLKIKNKNELFKDVESKRIEKFFWILDAHEDNISKLSFMESNKFKIIKNYNYKNARAVLVEKMD